MVSKMITTSVLSASFLFFSFIFTITKGSSTQHHQHHQHRLPFVTCAFSTPPGNNPSSGENNAVVSLFDRFRATCPADMTSIFQFDSSLMTEEENDDENTAWVAVYRSSNNSPSVFVRDEFMNAMQIATTSISTSSPEEGLEGKIEKEETSQEKEEGLRPPTPIAIGRIHPSPEFPHQFMMDELRCSLKKEDTNDSCDGGSEHTEALGVVVDELLLHHLRTSTSTTQQQKVFDETIRCKATLVSGPILEQRGFQQVAELSKDMATHTSDLDESMNKYAERAVSTSASAKNPGARDRALQILSLLGRLDRNMEKQKVVKDEKKGEEGEEDGNEGEEEYDPWANSKIF